MAILGTSGVIFQCWNGKFHVAYFATIEKKNTARHALGERAKGKWGKQETVWWWGRGWKRSLEKEASE